MVIPEFYVDRLVRHLQSQSQMEPPSLGRLSKRSGFCWRWMWRKMGVSENVVYPIFPMVLLIIIPIFYGYLFGNIAYFQTNPNEATKKPGTCQVGDIDLMDGSSLLTNGKYA